MSNFIVEAFKDDKFLVIVAQADIEIDNYMDEIALVRKLGQKYMVKFNLDLAMAVYTDIDDFDAMVRFFIKHELMHILLNHLLIQKPVQVDLSKFGIFKVVEVDPAKDWWLINLAADSIINSQIPEATILGDHLKPLEDWVLKRDKIKLGNAVGKVRNILFQNATVEELVAYLKTII